MPDKAIIPPVPPTAKRLAGKVMLITGSTQGCGEKIAMCAAAEGAEAITICGRSAENGKRVEAALKAAGAKAMYVKADLMKVEDCENVVSETLKAFGKIDGLVNCAAAAWRGTWWDAKPDLLDSLYKLNMRAPFIMMQNCAKAMKAAGAGGSIVNIGSINSHGGQSNIPGYASTKGALVTMTKNAAWAMRREHIRVNYIAVGWMYTPAEDKIMQSEGSDATWINDADAGHPYGRILRPVDVAKLCMHLLSDDAVMQSGSIIDLHDKFGLTCWDGQPKST